MHNWDGAVDPPPGSPGAFWGALAYALPGFGAALLLLWQRRSRFVRFHALQSIMLSVLLSVLGGGLALLSALPWIGFLYRYLTRIFLVTVFLYWVWLVVRAWRGRRDRAPLVGWVIERYLY